MALNDHAREVRSALTDASRLCAALGLDKGATRQAGGLLICCPAHGDRNPSCSVTTGKDGTIRANCFACDWSADALGVIALVRGLNTRIAEQFREVMAEGAAIAGHHGLAAEILDGRPMPDRPKVAPPSPREERAYPPTADVIGLWATGTPPADDVEVSGYLAGRVIDPVLVTVWRLARVIREPLPRWARYRGSSWVETGHRLACRVFDSDGKLRSVRAIQVRTGYDGPKRLPPAGHRAAELVLANRAAHMMLNSTDSPGRLGIVEGEPDWLWWSTRTEEPILGLVSGSWTDAFAAAVPRDCRVVIRTHNDAAGDRYADQVAESLKHKCTLIRRAPEAA